MKKDRYDNHGTDPTVIKRELYACGRGLVRRIVGSEKVPDVKVVT